MEIFASLLLLAWSCPLAAAADYVFVSLAGDKRIAVYQADLRDGSLKHRADVAIDGEPGALTVDSSHHFLFASVRSEGKLAAFRIGRTGQLKILSTVPAGADPAYLSTDKRGRFLLCAYYVAGKVTVHAIAADGSLDHKPRQEVATADNAHAVVLDPSNRFAFVPHTGPNAVFQFTFNAKAGRLQVAAVPKLTTPPRTGPRHLVFHPSLAVAYVDNEQGGSVTAYHFDADTGGLRPLQIVSTLPAGFKGENACAEVKVHPGGKFLYVSNRGHDSIASFALDARDGRLTALGRVPTEKTPRSFDLHPGGQFLYAAGESSGRLAAYRIDLNTGKLERFATYRVGKQPWWVLAVRVP
jgi:6-phosphogluconolactonase